MTYTKASQTFQTTAFGDLDTACSSPRIQIQFPYNINTDEIVIATTGSGVVSFSQPFAVCSTTAATGSTASLSSKNNLHYRTGQGGTCLLTAVFTPGVSGSTQLAGLANSLDGLFFGYNGDTFGINRRYNGMDNWIPQSSWNMDKMDGTGSSRVVLNPSVGNVYKIQMQWLGFGNIRFFIENAAAGTFVLVHMIEYPNTFTDTSLLNPSMQINIQANNTANNTNIVVKCPSMAAFVEGVLINTGLVNSINSGLKAITEAQSAVMTIRDNSTFNGIANYKRVRPTNLALFCNDDDVVWSLILNATIGGSPLFANINANTSVVSYDITGTTIAGGRTLATYFTQNNNAVYIDLSNLQFDLNPLDRLTIAAKTMTDDGITAAATINWKEEF